MTAVGVSSGFSRHIFNRADAAHLRDENRIQNISTSKLRSPALESRLGIIPQNACDEILRHCAIAEYDFAKLKAQTERIGYPVLPVAAATRCAVPGRPRRNVSLGRHHQDITDTATVLQIREALDLIEADLVAISDALAALAKRYRDTRWQAAAIFSRRCRSRSATRPQPYLAGFERISTFEGIAPRVLVRRVRRRRRDLVVAGQARPMSSGRAHEGAWLGQPRIAWHTVRDCIAEVGCFLGLVTGSCGRSRSM